MRFNDCIMKKREGQELSTEEINYMVEKYTDGEIPDYQMSAMLMAIFFKKMNDRETADLTMAMAKSGDMLDLSPIEGIKVDKHSTGGVGDKTSLVLGPMVAAVGVPVAKMSGRGLGHTGGTIDKLESIPGFSTSMDTDKFVNQVNSLKIALTGQTGNLAPADKKLYALRDVTATVENISLIASSIMSKKIAAGADVIVLDVKTGDGAFMKNEDDAKSLARTMVDIGKLVNRKTMAVISDMNQPLGNAVGNSLEVIEAIETLKGRGSEELLELCLELGSHMVVGGKVCGDVDEARHKLRETITSGTALAKFKEWVEAQGGDVRGIDDYSLLPQASIKKEVLATKDGYVSGIVAHEIGVASMLLGGGRKKKGDDIDLSVGVIINKKIGDYVKNGDVIAVIHGNDEEKVYEAAKKVEASYAFSKDKIEAPKLIKGIIS